MEGDAKSEAKGRNIEYHGEVGGERWGVGGQGVLPWMGPPMDLCGSPSSGDAHAALLLLPLTPLLPPLLLFPSLSLYDPQPSLRPSPPV